MQPLEDILRYVVPAYVSGALVYIFPFLKRPPLLIALGVFTVLAQFGEAAVGQFCWLALPFLLCLGIELFSDNASKAGNARWAAACMAMVLMTALFCLAELPFWHWLQFPAGPFLLKIQPLQMWTFIASISFLWEYGSGQSKTPAWKEYAVWSLLPFTQQGPVLRYSDFHRQLGMGLTSTPTWNAWFMLAALALIQIALSALIDPATTAIANDQLRKLIITFLSGPWGFYLKAAGTAHLMECGAALWGIKILPNYQRPFGRVNLSEFWMHWNISVTNIFRDYFFYNRWGRKTLNPYLNSVVLFVLVGLWHGRNIYWFSWGLLHGIGFASFLWFRQYRKRDKPNRSTSTSALGQWASAAVTYIFVCLCWYLPNKIALLFH